MGHRRLVRRGSRDNRHQRVGDGTAFPDTQLVSLRKTSVQRAPTVAEGGLSTDTLHPLAQTIASATVASTSQWTNEATAEAAAGGQLEEVARPEPLGQPRLHPGAISGQPQVASRQPLASSDHDGPASGRATS